MSLSVFITLVALVGFTESRGNVHLAPLFEAKARICGVTAQELDSGLIRDILAGAYEPIRFNDLDKLTENIHPRLYGQSCLSVPRNPLLYAMVNAGLARRELRDCQEKLFLRVDSNTGCVFQAAVSKSYDAWASPYYLLEQRFAGELSANDSVDQVDRFDLTCSNDTQANREENKPKLIMSRHRCHLIRAHLANSRCDGEHLRVLVARGDKVLECTEDVMIVMGGTLASVPGFMNTCMVQVGATC